MSGPRTSSLKQQARHPEAVLVVVEDDAAHGTLLSRLLRDMGYAQVDWLDDPRDALGRFAGERPDLVLMDHHMPHMSGLEMMRSAGGAITGVPVIMMTGNTSLDIKYQAYEAGVNDVLYKPIDRFELHYKVDNLLHFAFQHRQLVSRTSTLESVVETRTAQLREALAGVERSHEEALKVAGLALEYRDYETKGHTERVTLFVALLADAVGLSEEQKTHLRWGAYLHDVGKITVPDQILLKPGKLTEEEYALIKAHTLVGEKMLRQLSFLDDSVLQIVRHHHERWDGRGYPDGLKGHDTPLLARLFAVIDVYDALISRRPYKDAWHHAAAVDELVRQAGRQFDPSIIAAFLDIEKELGAFQTLEQPI